MRKGRIAVAAAIAGVLVLAIAWPRADRREPRADSHKPRAAGRERRPESREPKADELIVSAAASLADVMGELTKTYREEAGVELRVNTGGSNTLARQIVEGARVDVFLSADGAQMDIVERAGRLVPGSRADLLANALVVIVSTDGRVPVSRARDLAGPGVRRVAMGNPASVPAGVYGRRWLETLALWPQVSPKVVPLPTVRAALAAVQEGRADAGIVYATDARVTSAVRVAVVAPDDEAPAVLYPASAIRGAREDEARRLLAWLRGATAMRAFTGAGFRPITTPKPDFARLRRASSRAASPPKSEASHLQAKSVSPKPAQRAKADSVTLEP